LSKSNGFKLRLEENAPVFKDLYLAASLPFIEYSRHGLAGQAGHVGDVLMDEPDIQDRALFGFFPIGF
jgi:hypothetical protein